MFGNLCQVPALIPDRSASDPAGWIDQANDGKPGHRFARTGLSHEAEHLTVADRKRYIVDRFDHAGAGKKMRARIADLDRRVHRVRRGLSTSRNWSPTRLIDMIVISRAIPG